jgi:hypothetical protein
MIKISSIALFFLCYTNQLSPSPMKLPDLSASLLEEQLKFYFTTIKYGDWIKSSQEGRDLLWPDLHEALHLICKLVFCKSEIEAKKLSSELASVELNFREKGRTKEEKLTWIYLKRMIGITIVLGCFKFKNNLFNPLDMKICSMGFIGINDENLFKQKKDAAALLLGEKFYEVVKSITKKEASTCVSELIEKFSLDDRSNLGHLKILKILLGREGSSRFLRNRERSFCHIEAQARLFSPKPKSRPVKLIMGSYEEILESYRNPYKKLFKNLPAIVNSNLSEEEKQDAFEHAMAKNIQELFCLDELASAYAAVYEITHFSNALAMQMNSRSLRSLEA